MEKINSLPLFADNGASLEASKWLSYEILLNEEEMGLLLSDLSPSEFFILSKPLPEEKEAILPKEKFLEVYSSYVENLKKGAVSFTPLERLYFSSGLSQGRDPFFTQKVAGNQLLLRIKKPILQLRAHAFHFSQEERKVYVEIFGKNSLPWGIQIAYPQLFKDEEGEVKTSLKEVDYPNTKLFKSLQKWVREHTLPLRLEDSQGFIQTSLKIGYKAFAEKLGEKLLLQKGYGKYAD